MSFPYLLADKPAGVSTHSPDGKREGFVEFLSRTRGGEDLRVCHRLDKDTSGAVVFARTAQAARELGDLFARHEVSKKYLMLTDRQLPIDDEIEIRTDIDRRGSGEWFSSGPRAGEGNAHSHFARLQQSDRHTLWEVQPRTGKPHQIRLHAEQLGIPVLGDGEHGGTPFCRTMLHAAELSFCSESAGGITHTVAAPPPFDDLSLLDDAELTTWLINLDRRRRLFSVDGATTIRLLHDGDVRCDLFGSVCWFYWYRKRAPEQGDLDRIATFAATVGATSWKVQVMGDRGVDPQARQQFRSAEFADAWTAEEHGLQYRFKADQGLSPGLFLDQRQNRLWLKENAADRKVLNLFSYTAGFSLCAAAGGAVEVVSVDTSKSSLEWAKENFALNGMAGEHIEFWAADARFFLRGCQSKDRRFDVIICDPPSFSRSQEGVFRIEDDLAGLTEQMLAVLVPGGTALISTNFEGWSQAQLESAVGKAATGAGSIEVTPLPDWDYELPGTEPLMKSLLLRKAG